MTVRARDRAGCRWLHAFGLLAALVVLSAGFPEWTLTPGRAGARSRLAFMISLPKSRFVLGEPIPLTMQLRNVSRRTLVVNRRLAIYDREAPPITREVFLRIMMPSGRLAEVALFIDRHLIGPEGFARLAPGAAAQETVDLAHLFFLGETGRYDIRAVYQNTLRGPMIFDASQGRFIETDIGALRVRIRSNALTFRIL